MVWLKPDHFPLYLYVCAYRYIYIYIYAYMYVCISVYMCIYVYVYMYTYICSYIQLYIFICIYIYIFIIPRTEHANDHSINVSLKKGCEGFTKCFIGSEHPQQLKEGPLWCIGEWITYEWLNKQEQSMKSALCIQVLHPNQFSVQR